MSKTHKKLDPTPEAKELREIEAHERHLKLQTYLRGGHRAPKTRREFLASGLIGVSGFVAAPSVLELVLRSGTADAQVPKECPGDNATAMMPYVAVNLSSGAALMANYVPHNAGGELLTSYSVMGLGAPNSFNIVREFGNVPFPVRTDGTPLSGFLEGIRTGLGQGSQALAKTAFVAYNVRSQDDTGNNALDPSGLISAAGLAGSDLPKMGTRNTPTGINQVFAVARPPAPLIANNFAAIQGALAAGGIIAQQLSDQSQRISLLKLVKNLSSSQKRNLASSSSAQTLGKLVECATGKNIELATNTNPGIDPRQDAQVAPIWGQQANTNNGQTVQAALAYNALNGKAGAVGIDLGGYDYHGSNRGQTTQADNNAGQVVGRILRTAEVMNKPVFINVTSDGAVGSQNSQTPDSNFTGDRGSAGTGFIIVFHPSGRPATSGFQIGSFTNAQAADDQFIPGWGAEKAAIAVFANYLKLNNKLSLLDTLANRPFDTSQLSRVLKFA